MQSDIYALGLIMFEIFIGFAVTLRGTIESGAGAGERVTAEVKCTFLRVSCRIVTEAFG